MSDDSDSSDPEHQQEQEIEQVDDDFDEQDTDLDIKKLCPIICNSKNTIDFLTENGIIKSSQRCSKSICRRQMTLVPTTDKMAL
jgi:hypothetical protein